MRVLKNSADSVDLLQRVSDVSNTCGGGEFDARRVGLDSLVLGSFVEEQQERKKMQQKDKFEMSGQATGKARATGAAVQEGD